MRRLVLPLLALTLVSLILVGGTATAQWSFYAGNHVVKDHERFTLTLLPPGDAVPVLEVRRVLANAPLAVFTSVPHGLATGDTIVLAVDETAVSPNPIQEANVSSCFSLQLVPNRSWTNAARAPAT